MLRYFNYSKNTFVDQLPWQERWEVIEYPSFQPSHNCTVSRSTCCRVRIYFWEYLFSAGSNQEPKVICTQKGRNQMKSDQWLALRCSLYRALNCKDRWLESLASLILATNLSFTISSAAKCFHFADIGISSIDTTEVQIRSVTVFQNGNSL